MDSQLTFAILTVSDTCHSGINTDRTGPALHDAILAAFPKARILSRSIVPDEPGHISPILRQWSDGQPFHNVVLTNGGTGFSPRDVTPEVTRAVLDRETPGISSAMLVRSMVVTDMAMLSRAVSGIRKKTLIINLPGSPKGATECFGFIKNIIPHAVALVCDDIPQVVKAHNELGNKTSPSKVGPLSSESRERFSPFPMVSVNDAIACVKKETTEMLDSLSCIDIDLPRALGYHLAEDIYSVEPVPSFRASIMDGYALNVDFQKLPKIVNVKEAIAAGDKYSEVILELNEAIRISTGAQVPDSANCVIPIENTILVATKIQNNDLETIEITDYPKQKFIRDIGTDIAPNSLIARVGEEISPGHIGAFASVGCMRLKVHQKQLSVGIISTGNELQPATAKVLEVGQIRDSNKLTLINLLKKHGLDAEDLGIVKDKPDDLKAAFTRGFERCDAIISTGGVSMGEHDYIKRVLTEDFNAVIHFGRVNMKPGKPTTFATLQFHGKKKTVFGLPGNPASATVTAILFVVPFIRYIPLKKRSPATYDFLKVSAHLDKGISLDERPEYKRANLAQEENEWFAKLTGDQISSRIQSFINANSLLILPGKTNECPELKAGDIIEAILI